MFSRETGSEAPKFTDIVGAYACLLAVHCLMKTGFGRLHRVITKLKPLRARQRISTKAIVAAVDNARIFYFTQVRCLQYAAAIVCLARLHGWPAELVIGVTERPFFAHAWVELDSRLVAGATSDHQKYLQIIERI